MGYIKTTIMKKIIFFAICLLVAGSVSAQGYYYGPRKVVRRPAPRQNDFYKVRLGITGGVIVVLIPSSALMRAYIWICP